MDSVDSVECASFPWRCASGLRHAAGRLPRPLRFLGVGAAGLATDLAVFTVILGVGHHPFAARLVSLAVATVVTWRLNRAVTFDPTGRRQRHEAMRYALVTAVAQGTNYTVFATLVIVAFARIPQAAVLAGAVAGAGLSYAGHRLFSFARHAPFAGALSNSEQRIALR